MRKKNTQQPNMNLERKLLLLRKTAQLNWTLFTYLHIDKSIKQLKLNEGIEMNPKKGNLYYWQKQIVVEFVGCREDGKYIFNTTNGIKISLYQDQVQTQISEDQ